MALLAKIAPSSMPWVAFYLVAGGLFAILFLVSVAVFTRNSLLSVIEGNDKLNEERLNSLLKASNAKDARTVLAEAQAKLIQERGKIDKKTSRTW